MDLKKYLDERGIRYTHFAKQIGISYKTLWDILQGSGVKKIETAEKITKLTEGKVKIKDLGKKEKKCD